MWQDVYDQAHRGLVESDGQIHPACRANGTRRATTGRNDQTGDQNKPIACSPSTRKRWASATTKTTRSEAQALIVDETSMFSPSWPMRSCEGDPPSDAQVLLVGDVDQLPSVGPGMVSYAT